MPPPPLSFAEPLSLIKKEKGRKEDKWGGGSVIDSINDKSSVVFNKIIANYCRMVFEKFFFTQFYEIET